MQILENIIIFKQVLIFNCKNRLSFDLKIKIKNFEIIAETKVDLLTKVSQKLFMTQTNQRYILQSLAYLYPKLFYISKFNEYLKIFIY